MEKKIIFTNGSRSHAENVTKRIGIDISLLMEYLIYETAEFHS